MSILLDLKTGDPDDAAARFQLAGYDLAHDCGAGDAVTFEPAGHIYRLRDTGEILPSVTQILRATGVSTDFEALREMGQQRRHAIDLKRDIGVALHADAHAFDDDDIVIDGVNAEVRPYLDAYIRFRRDYPHLRPATRERLVYNPAYRYVGTLDGIFMLEGELEIAITEWWSVQLMPKNRVPYHVTPYNEDHYTDREKFKAFVTTYYEQSDRRRAA